MSKEITDFSASIDEHFEFVLTFQSFMGSLLRIFF